METVLYKNQEWNVEYFATYNIYVCNSADDSWYAKINSSWYEFGPKRTFPCSVIDETKKHTLKEVCTIFMQYHILQKEENQGQRERINLKTYRDINYSFVFENTENVYLRTRKQPSHCYYRVCKGEWFVTESNSQWQAVQKKCNVLREETYNSVCLNKTTILQSWACKTLLADGFTCQSTGICTYLRNSRGEWCTTVGTLISKYLSSDMRNFLDTVYFSVNDILLRSGKSLQMLESEVNMQMSQYIFEFLYDTTIRKSYKKSGFVLNQLSKEMQESLTTHLKNNSSLCSEGTANIRTNHHDYSPKMPVTKSDNNTMLIGMPPAKVMLQKCVIAEGNCKENTKPETIEDKCKRNCSGVTSDNNISNCTCMESRPFQKEEETCEIEEKGNLKVIFKKHSTEDAKSREEGSTEHPKCTAISQKQNSSSCNKANRPKSEVCSGLLDTMEKKSDKQPDTQNSRDSGNAQNILHTQYTDQTSYGTFLQTERYIDTSSSETGKGSLKDNTEAPNKTDNKQLIVENESKKQVQVLKVINSSNVQEQLYTQSGLSCLEDKAKKITISRKEQSPETSECGNDTKAMKKIDNEQLSIMGKKYEEQIRDRNRCDSTDDLKQLRTNLNTRLSDSSGFEQANQEKFLKECQAEPAHLDIMEKEKCNSFEIKLGKSVTITSNQSSPSQTSVKEDGGGLKNKTMDEQGNQIHEIDLKPLHKQEAYLKSVLFIISVKMKMYYRNKFNSLDWLKDGRCFTFSFKSGSSVHCIRFKGFCSLSFKRILLWGEASLGKSSLCALMTKNWCEDLLKSFDLCFFVSLSKAKQFDSLLNILTDIIFEDIEVNYYEKEYLEAAIISAEDKVLIICDELDKLNSKDRNTFLSSIERSSCLQKAKIIITSRPTEIDENILKSLKVLEMERINYKGVKHSASEHSETLDEKEFTAFWKNCKSFFSTNYPPRYLHSVYQYYKKQQPFKKSLYDLLHQIMTTFGRESGYELNAMDNIFCHLGQLCLQILKKNARSVDQNVLRSTFGKHLPLINKLDIFTESTGHQKGQFNCNKLLVVFFTTLFLRHNLAEAKNPQQVIKYLCPDDSIPDFAISNLDNGETNIYIVGIFPEIALEVKLNQNLDTYQNTKYKVEMYHDITDKIEMSSVFDSTNILLRVSQKYHQRFGFQEIEDPSQIQDLFNDIINMFNFDGTIEMRFFRNAYEGKVYLVWTVEDSEEQCIILQGVVVKSEADSSGLSYNKLHLSFLLSKAVKLLNVLQKLLHLEASDSAIEEHFSLENLLLQIWTAVEKLNKQYFVSFSMSEANCAEEELPVSSVPPKTLSFELTNTVSNRAQIVLQIQNEIGNFHEPLIVIYLK